MSVSVIIPTYNNEDTISRAISSALGQSIAVKEVIVVNDGSTDNTGKKIKSFEDDRIQYIKHEENKGGSVARNTGLRHASGDYIAYLDADDEWLPKKLEKQHHVLESRSDEWVAVHCERTWDISLRNKIGFALASIVGTKKSDPLKEGGEELIKEILTLNLSTGASTLLVKKETVDEIDGFDPRFPRHQDWEFLIRVLKQGKLAYVDEPLVIKHGTGRPSIDTYEQAKALLLSEFDSEVHELESQGYEITHIQQLQLTKLYIEEGELRRGIRRLNPEELELREFLSVLWYLPDGIKTRLFDW